MPNWRRKAQKANDRAFRQSIQAEDEARRETQRQVSLANFKVKGNDELLSANLTDEEMEEVLKALVSLGVEYQITN